MGKITNGVIKINFTMLYGNYCYIIIENFPQKSFPCTIRWARPMFYSRSQNSSASSSPIISFNDYNNKDPAGNYTLVQVTIVTKFVNSQTDGVKSGGKATCPKVHRLWRVVTPLQCLEHKRFCRYVSERNVPIFYATEDRTLFVVQTQPHFHDRSCVSFT